jgi:transposase, IS30 family
MYMQTHTYRRLTFAEREEISRALAEGLSLRDVSKRINRSSSTVVREVQRSGLGRIVYRAGEAHSHALRRARARRLGYRKLRLNPRLRTLVLRHLARLWSPEQIARIVRRMHPNDPSMQVSHETIYRYLYVLPRGELKRTLTDYLRQAHRHRHHRTSQGKPRGHQGHIPDMVSIEERPAEVADRTVPGHWEGDLILGKGRSSALGTLVERTTRTVILVRLKNKKAPSVRTAFARAIRTLPTPMKKSLTYDRGWEMAEHKRFTLDTHMQVYFAHPKSPWERGTNENTNGLIRQFFPKGTDFSKVPYHRIKRAEFLLNTRPRKVLDWRTPYEAFNALVR